MGVVFAGEEEETQVELFAVANNKGRGYMSFSSLLKSQRT